VLLNKTSLQQGKD